MPSRFQSGHNTRKPLDLSSNQLHGNCRCSSPHSRNEPQSFCSHKQQLQKAKHGGLGHDQGEYSAYQFCNSCSFRNRTTVCRQKHCVQHSKPGHFRLDSVSPHNEVISNFGLSGNSASPKPRGVTKSNTMTGNRSLAAGSVGRRSTISYEAKTASTEKTNAVGGSLADTPR